MAGPKKIVSVWNPKGGQGKSLIVLNLAAAVSEPELLPWFFAAMPKATPSTVAKARSFSLRRRRRMHVRKRSIWGLALKGRGLSVGSSSAFIVRIGSGGRPPGLQGTM